MAYNKQLIAELKCDRNADENKTSR